MSADTYLRAENSTELFSDIRQTVRNMRSLQEELTRFRDITGQMDIDGPEKLAEFMGFVNPDNAQAVKGLISSSLGEILNCPLYQQTISRMG